jgi:hypothetical protein
VSLDVLAWPRPAGRTETLTRAITPTTDETERDTKTPTENNQEGLCAISTFKPKYVEALLEAWKGQGLAVDGATKCAC